MRSGWRGGRGGEDIAACCADEAHYGIKGDALTGELGAQVSPEAFSAGFFDELGAPLGGEAQCHHAHFVIRIGDWELDTVHGKNNTFVMLTMVERATRFVYVVILPNRKAPAVRDALIESLFPIKHLVHTLTSDNGKEFAGHEAVSDALQADFYFAHPYASWERGTNENTNGLIRQYFPKGYDFATITSAQLAHVVDQINNRPRKCPIQVVVDICWHLVLFSAQIVQESGLSSIDGRLLLKR